MGGVAVDRPCLVLARGRRLRLCDPTGKGGPVGVEWKGRNYRLDLPAAAGVALVEGAEKGEEP